MKDDRKRREDLLRRIQDAVLKVLAGYDYKARIVISTDDTADITEIHYRAYEQFLQTISDPSGWETTVHKNAIRNHREDVTQFELVLENIIREFLSYEDGPHFIRDIAFLDLKPLNADRLDSIESKLEQIHQSSVEQTGRLEQIRQTAEEQTGRIEQSIESKIGNGFEKRIENKIENRIGSSFEKRIGNKIEKSIGKVVETQTKQQEDRLRQYTENMAKQQEDRLKRVTEDLTKQLDILLERKKDSILEEIHGLREEMLQEFRSYGEQAEHLCLSAVEETDAKLFYRSEITKEFSRIIEEAKSELVIVSPFINGWYRFTEEGAKLRFGFERYRTPLINAAKRGVRIHLAYGWNDSGDKSKRSNRSDRNSKSPEEKSRELRSILSTLKEYAGDQKDPSGAYRSDSEKIMLYEGDTHIKCVIMDNSYMLLGSCNLLSSDPSELSDRMKTHAEIMISCTNPELIRKMKEYCLTPGEKLFRIRRPEEIGTHYLKI